MLLDTSGLFSYHDRRDARHGDAVTFFDTASVRITHSYVLAEFVPLCYTRALDRMGALSFVTDLLDNPHVEVVWVDQVLHRVALAFLRSRLDKDYSLCDAVSFLLMRYRGLSEALTTDRHFSQEGFQRLLKP